MKNIKELKNKKIIFLGLGIENLSLLKYILNSGVEANLVIADPLPPKKLEQRLAIVQQTARKNKLPEPKFKRGKSYDKNLAEFDLIFRSPGYPLFSSELKKAKMAGVEISSPIKLFFELCPTRNLIGVTGTKGKGTTASLIYEILKQAGKEVWLGGNIGIPPFDFLAELQKNSWVVLELSSFQLEDLEISPRIGVITNLYKEHLRASDPNNPNYHKSLNGYWRAKLNLIKHQNQGDKAIVNQNIARAASPYALKSDLITFSRSDLKSKLFGEHNKENIAAACEVGRVLKIKRQIIERAVKSYNSLEHRLELVGEDKEKVKYFNDSFATTPEATITALNAFESPVILLAGGAEKDSDFKDLVRVIRQKVKFLILFSGQATPRLRREARSTGFPAPKIKTVYSMEEAVELAQEKKDYGDIVLLSPACASFGLFENYKQRGSLFKEEVKKLNL